MMENLEVIVVGNKRKKILTTDYLKNISHRVFYTTDYNLPRDFKIDPRFLKYISACKNKLGAYRCFRGHQDALSSCTKDYILGFEDDAVPNREDWLEIIKKSINLLDSFEVVSFHGRKFDINRFEEFDNNGNIFLKPKDAIFSNDVYVNGSPLCYLIKKDTVINKIKGDTYIGNPFDLYLDNNFSFCLIKNSPFNHDRKMGSLIDNFRGSRR